MFALGAADDDFNNDPTMAKGNDPYLNAIRAISVPMGYLRKDIDAQLNNVSNADAVVNFDQLSSDLQQMNAYATALPAAIAAYKASPAWQADSAQAAELNNWLAFVVDWAGGTISALGNLPTDAANWAADQLQKIADAAGRAANTAAWDALKAIAPLLLVGGAVLFLLEGRSRTYRKLVA